MSRPQHAHQAPDTGGEMPVDLRAIMAHRGALAPFLYQPTRLHLLVVLAKQTEVISFHTLLEWVRLQQSGLSMQLTLLERAGMLEIEKRKKERYTETAITLTPAGQGAFMRHRDHLLAALHPWDD